MENQTELFRVKKEDNFTRVYNEVLRRKDISWKAKGILVYILSLPDDWNIYLEEVAKHSTDGMTSFRNGWNELKKAGYVERYAVREKGKIVSWKTIVKESVGVKAILPLTEKPQVVNPQVDNDKLLTTYSTNDLSKLNKDTVEKLDDVPYQEIVEYLNKITHSNYKHGTPKTRTLIKARYNEGFKIDDFKRVIDVKTNEWKLTDNEKYLRPDTLFGTKFEGYANQKDVANRPKFKNNKPIANTVDEIWSEL